jgi:mannose-1-phosphate guanylyltransferase
VHVGEPLPPPHGVKPYKTTFFKAERFVEKPNYDRALEYLNSGHYRWNAGMFIWSFITVTNGLDSHQKEMAEACRRWFKVAWTPKLAKVLAKEYPALPKISIDYALLEHAQNVVVAAGDFAWDDLGSWTALGRHLKLDPEGNGAVADFIHVDAARNVVYDARTKNRTPIAIVGLRDSIVVMADDATLVAHKSQAQKVKELVSKLGADPKYRKLV